MLSVFKQNKAVKWNQPDISATKMSQQVEKFLAFTHMPPSDTTLLDA